MGIPRRTTVAFLAALVLASVFNDRAASAQAAALEPPGADPPSTTDRIDGVVVSSVDSKPVSRVLVTTGDRRFAALTDYEGRFSFDLRRPLPDPGDAGNPNSLSAGVAQQRTMNVQFQLRKPGYVNGNVMVYFATVRTDAPQPPIQLTIQPSATLIGRVDSESGDSPANFVVQIHRKNLQDGRPNWNATSIARVNPGGEFRAGDLTPGDYKIDALVTVIPAGGKNPPASITRLLPAFYPDAASLDAAVPIHIVAGDTVSANLILRRATFYRVTVPIAGDAAQGLRAILMPAAPGLSLNYNAADHALEGYLPTGDYDVHLISTPRPPALSNGSGVVMFVAPDTAAGSDVLCATVHLGIASAPIETKPVALRPIHRIPVQVNAELTGPESSQDVTRRSMYSFNLMPEDGDGFAETQPQPRVARGTNVPPQSPAYLLASGGRYHFTFYANGAYVASAVSGGVDLLDQPLIVDDNVAPQPIYVTLRDDYAFLNVRFASSPATAPVSPAAAAATTAGPTAYALAIPLDRIESQNLGPFGLFASNSPAGLRNGGYPFQLPPGHYLVLAASDIQSLINIEYRNPDVLRDLTSRGVTVNLSPGDKTDIEVPLMSGSSGLPTQVFAADAQ